MTTMRFDQMFSFCLRFLLGLGNEFASVLVCHGKMIRGAKIKIRDENAEDT